MGRLRLAEKHTVAEQGVLSCVQMGRCFESTRPVTVACSSRTQFQYCFLVLLYNALTALCLLPHTHTLTHSHTDTLTHTHVLLSTFFSRHTLLLLSQGVIAVDELLAPAYLVADGGDDSPDEAEEYVEVDSISPAQYYKVGDSISCAVFDVEEGGRPLLTQRLPEDADDELAELVEEMDQVGLWWWGLWCLWDHGLGCRA